jgi:sugar lactone lactonase YvrE
MRADVMVLEAALANATVSTLGESPVWDPVDETVLWVDVPVGIVHVGTLEATDEVAVHKTIEADRPVSSIAITERGGWLMATGDECVLRESDGTIGRRVRLPLPSGSRLNDGGTDPAGRYLVGSCREGEGAAQEVLLRLSADGSTTTIDNDLTLSNGLAWSVDGTTMYSVDSLRGRIYRRAYDSDSGAAGPRSEWLVVTEGIPDGMCVDEEDHVWVAIWGRGEVRRYSPDGALAALVHVPAPHTTSVAFAGPELHLLLITSATEGLTAAERARFPDAGCLFAVRPPVRGAPVAPWRPI